MDLFEFIQKNDMVKILLILAGVYFFMRFYNQEHLDNTASDVKVVAAEKPAVQPVAQKEQAPAPSQNEHQEHVDSVVAGKAQLSTSDLLPTYNEASDFAKENPVSKLLQEQNFLQAGYHMGINTVVQSNKIPYLDLRSAPPIPKQEVSPFLNSSYEEPAGAKRRFMEIGA
jgi:hypothetical protein